MEGKKVFVDSSVLVAACLSSKGASYFILVSAPESGYKFFINEIVFEETLGVLKRKFPGLRNIFFGFLSISNISVLKNPSKKDLKSVKNLIEEKDTPILVSSIQSTDYLLTLDKGFFKKEVIDFAKRNRLTISSPKEFISLLK